MHRNLRLSIIIPVYNLESYIEQTVDSCLTQDISSDEYEIICIDDGSKDNSLVVLNRLAALHSNVRVISKVNGGVSQARNLGLASAIGQYIWFVDGDDLLTPNCLGTLLHIAESENTDLLWFRMRNFVDNPKYDSEIPGHESCDDRSRLYDFMFTIGGGGVCVNMYRREMLRAHSIRFNECMKYSEDVLFNFAVLLNACKCTKVEFVAYHYRQRPGSAMHSENTEKFIESLRTLVDEYDAMLRKEKDAKWKKTILNNRDRAVRALLFSLVRAGDVNKTSMFLNDLEQHHFYPYKLMPKALIRNKSFKQFLINLLSFPFPYKSYTLAMTKCFNKLKR